MNIETSIDKSTLFDTFVDRNGAPIIGNIEKHVANFSKQELKDRYSDDPWLGNLILNIWEYVHGVDVVESYPWNVTLPIADICNARCTFCTSWLVGTNFLKPDQVKRYEEVVPYSYHFGYQGHGEPLANPHIKELLQYFGERLDKRCFTYIITNGVFLGDVLEDVLAAEINVINVSLNATTPEIHDTVMGLGPDAFDKVISTLKKISALKLASVKFTVSMVLTADNMHQAADFVRLGNEIGASTIYLRSLSTQSVVVPGLNYHNLAPKLHPDFETHKNKALKAIEQSIVQVVAQPDTWEHDSVTAGVRKKVEASEPKLFDRKSAIKDEAVRKHYRASRERHQTGKGELLTYVDDLVENPYGRGAPFDCKFIYYNLISTSLTWSVSPCCYMTNVPGHNSLVLQEGGAFRDFWNSEAYVNLRRRLQEGPLFQSCATCPMQG